MNNRDKEIQKMKDLIDDYNNTVYAIIGFLNTYKHELKTNYSEINFFQGRKLFVNETQNNFVTPDLGLTLDKEHGLVGEVKYSFPKEIDRWKDDFIQIKKYDSILSGWPTENGLVQMFDIVLLVQQSRSRAIKDYYIQLDENFKIKNRFAIIEFNRSSQGKEYFQFRIEHGELSNKKIHAKFYNGLPVPMHVYVGLYAKIKIYDSPPPLPLMLCYIYECVIEMLITLGKYKKITKNSKQIVIFTLQEMTKKLTEIYSFKSLQSKKHMKNQPEYPKQDWVKTAMEHLISIGEGNWVNKSNGEFKYILTHKQGSVLGHYIKTSLGHQTNQQLYLNFGT